MEINAIMRKPLVLGNVRYTSSMDFRLTKCDLERAHRKLNETEQKKREGLKVLKEKLARDKGVKYRIDDDYLLRYLRYAKFDYDRAYKAVRKFCSMKRVYGGIFALSPDLESLLKLEFYSYLPYCDENGNIVFLMKFRKWNLKKTSLTEILQVSLAVTDMMLTNPKCQINGVIGVWDMRGMSERHIAEISNPQNLWMMTKLLQDCYPFRLKCLIALYCSAFIQESYKEMQHLVKEKLINRIKLLGSDIRELYQYVNPDILPKKYGGMLDEEECNITQEVLNNLPYLEYERSFGDKV